MDITFQSIEHWQNLMLHFIDCSDNYQYAQSQYKGSVQPYLLSQFLSLALIRLLI